MIPEAAVEAAGKVAYEVKPVELFGRDAPVTWDQLSESALGQAHKDHELIRARRALEAAAPHIRAQALEDAADKFGEAASWSDGRPSPEQVQRWLRAGAAAERGSHGDR